MPLNAPLWQGGAQGILTEAAQTCNMMRFLIVGLCAADFKNTATLHIFSETAETYGHYFLMYGKKWTL